ncbi:MULTISPECIES: transporter [Sphingomonas]|uniref:Transporter n=1 Tax=Sphingomonas kyungheensis TaxID=1069987 RepID=A0ABU8H5S2_9SPHN|nr:transporter [Sphingomonas sp. CV7422]
MGSAIAALAASQAAAAQDGQAGVTAQPIRFDVAAPLSPSSGTSTVSPSSVPQAMERMRADDTTADLSLGTIYAQGKFGTGSTTSIWSSALGARLRVGDWTLSASLPWMRIRSRSTIFTGIDSTPILVAPDTAPVRRTNQGFGDLTLGASYTIVSDSTPLEVQLSGRAKINTATASSRLSSGENDYAAGVDVSYPIGKVTPFAAFSYRFLGDTALYRLRDGPAASAGASYALDSNSFLLASYHYSRAATRLVDDAHELFAGASTRLRGTPLRATGFATVGLSRGAAAASAGLSLSLDLRRRDAR